MRVVSLIVVALGILNFGIVRAQVGADVWLQRLGDDVFEGDKVVVEVMVSANEETLGTDLVLEFDETKLELVEVVSGDVYPKNSKIEVEEMEEGRVVYSGVAEIGKSVTPEGELVEVVFEAIENGSAQIEIAYEEGSTVGTGIIPAEGEGDNLLLTQPEGMEVKILKISWWQRIVRWVKELFGR